MTISYTFDANSKQLRTKVSGAVTIDDICRHFESVINDETIDQVSAEIIDTSQNTKPQFGYAESERFAHEYSDFKKSLNIERVVFIAGEDLQFGVSRMLATIMSQFVEVQIVRNIEEAEVFLKDDQSGTHNQDDN